MAAPVLNSAILRCPVPPLAGWGGQSFGIGCGLYKGRQVDMSMQAAALSYAGYNRANPHDLSAAVLLWFITRRDDLLPKVHAHIAPRLAVWMQRTGTEASDHALAMAFLDATEYVLSRRAGVNAKDRAWELVLRKQTYLAIRGFIARMLWAAIDRAFVAYQSQWGTKRTRNPAK